MGWLCSPKKALHSLSINGCIDFCCHDQLSQRENEVSVLGGQLRAELEKMQEDAGLKEVTQLLQHANTDIVRTSCVHARMLQSYTPKYLDSEFPH